MIGLAGLLLPYVGGFTEKTQNSSSADSLAEVSKAIHRFDAQYMAFPDGFDSLVDNSATGNLISDWLPDSTAATDNLEVCTISADQLTNLQAAEIDSLFPMVEATATNVPGNDFNATFDGVVTGSTGTNGATPIVGGTTKVACIKHAQLQTLLIDKLGVEVDADDLSATATDHDNEFYVMGVGQKSQMSGKTISEAPVYFSTANPSAKYSRFLAIFRVSKTAGTRAQFIAALAPDLKTQADFQQAHFASIQDGD
ncbi:hypothetical protein IVG45_11330 [Methylomonas sp. LL1]|uniref:hypothetical protein n=1 Tax=Methylomonas sp. LL1 TaxID=2785785 RepID=UPI0018C428AD|nr:hypothetical protein [Methylomonas sp. LL1]QPK61497.1 hypothetical protein IVG45_11330 [Methylomonas sp. LL1]